MTAWIAAASHPQAAIPAALVSAWLAWDFVCMAIGLACVPDKVGTLKALALSPLYLAVWAKGAALALASGEAWLRARPIGEVPHPAREAGGGH